MSRKVNICGHKDESIAARNCLECKRVAMAVYRGKPIEEVLGKPSIKDPTCRTCKMRGWLPTPPLRDTYQPMLLEPKQVAYLENAARLFDQLADGDRWTANDFIAWLKPDLTGKYATPPAIEGVARMEGGGRKGSGPTTTRHTSPDPIPYFSRRMVG